MLGAHLRRIWCSNKVLFAQPVGQFAHFFFTFCCTDNNLNQAALAYSFSMEFVCPGSADFPAILEREIGRVVVICSQRPETLYIKMWNFFFFTTSMFCSVSCGKVHYEYWYYLKWFNIDDVNNLMSFSIYSNKIIQELLQKPRRNFLPQVEILFRNHVFKRKVYWALCVLQTS